jgi:hypothetical protein
VMVWEGIIYSQQTQLHFIDADFVTFWPLFPLFCLYLVWSGRELAWAVYVLCFYVCFLFRPSMVLNQRQVSLVVSDWESYLGSLGFTVGLWVFVSVWVFVATWSCFGFHHIVYCFVFQCSVSF